MTGADPLTIINLCKMQCSMKQIVLFGVDNVHPHTCCLVNSIGTIFILKSRYLLRKTQKAMTNSNKASFILFSRFQFLFWTSSFLSYFTLAKVSSEIRAISIVTHSICFAMNNSYCFCLIFSFTAVPVQLNVVEKSRAPLAELSAFNFNVIDFKSSFKRYHKLTNLSISRVGFSGRIFKYQKPN